MSSGVMVGMNSSTWLLLVLWHLLSTPSVVVWYFDQRQQYRKRTGLPSSGREDPVIIVMPPPHRALILERFSGVSLLIMGVTIAIRQNICNVVAQQDSKCH